MRLAKENSGFRLVLETGEETRVSEAAESNSDGPFWALRIYELFGPFLIFCYGPNIYYFYGKFYFSSTTFIFFH